MNTIFKPKQAINSLSSDRIDKKLILYLIIIVAITTILSFFGFSGDVLRGLIIDIQKNLGSLNEEKIGIILNVYRDLFFMFIIYILIYVILIVIFNWLIKIILKLFRKEISLYKLLNITIYTTLFNRFLILLLSLPLAILYPIIKNISDDQIVPIVMFFSAIISISTLIIFIYAIKVSVKNKIKQG